MAGATQDESEHIAEVTLIEQGEPTRVGLGPVSYTHLRAHETVLDLVCRLLLEKKTQADR